MPNTNTGQRSGTRFEISDHEIQPSGSKSTFEILPESDENRKKSFTTFALDIGPKAVVGTEVRSPSWDVETPAPKKAGPDVNAYIAELLTNAETLLNHSEKDLARVLVYEALRVDSSHPVALLKAAQFLDPKRDLEKLLRLQREVCRVNLNFETMAELGHLHYRAGEDGKALQVYYETMNLLLDDSDGIFEVYKNVGVILTREGDFAGAEEYFNKAYATDPDSDTLLMNLGTLSIQQQDFALALERFRKALDLNPKNDKAWVGLALVHQQMGDFQLAMANVEKALDFNPANRTAVHVFANWAVRDDKSSAAIEKIQEYLSTVNLDEDLSLVLVHLFCKTNQLHLALLEIERVLLWEPTNEKIAQIEIEIRKMIKGKR